MLGPLATNTHPYTLENSTAFERDSFEVWEFLRNGYKIPKLWVEHFGGVWATQILKRGFMPPSNGGKGSWKTVVRGVTIGVLASLVSRESSWQGLSQVSHCCHLRIIESSPNIYIYIINCWIFLWKDVDFQYRYSHCLQDSPHLLVWTFEDLLVSSQLQKAEEKIDTHLRNTHLS